MSGRAQSRPFYLVQNLFQNSSRQVALAIF